MKFGEMIRSLGYESKDDIKRKKLNKELKSAQEVLENVQGFASDASNSSGGDHAAIVRWEEIITKTKAELAEIDAKSNRT